MVYQNRLIALMEQVFRHKRAEKQVNYLGLNPRLVGQVFRRLDLNVRTEYLS